MYAVELLENLAQVLLLDAYAGIADGDRDLAGRGVPRADVEIQRLIGLAVLDGVVDEVEDDIAEMRLADRKSG